MWRDLGCAVLEALDDDDASMGCLCSNIEHVQEQH